MLRFPPTFEECGSLLTSAFASLRFGERLERGRIRPSPCEGAEGLRGVGWLGQSGSLAVWIGTGWRRERNRS